MSTVLDQITDKQAPVDAPAGESKDDVVVAVRGLSKVFKDFWGRPKAKAVSNVDFEVRRGEVLGLLGPNGSGKSTTIKMLLGLLYPTKGHIEVFGKSPRDVATKAKIGYLPEESYLYRFLSSEETLKFFGSLFQLDNKDRDRRIEQLIEMVGLKNATNRMVGEFSKGMQRRIGLAQALINDPDLIILDEPTAGMDPIGCREIKDLVMALAKRGKTVILSSHLLADVEDVCDRVVIYYGGQVRAMGNLKDLLKEPDTLQITTPVMSKETTKKVLEIIRADVGEGNVRLDNPTQNLESYFLGVVRKARETEETSGATSGSEVAAYLRGDGSKLDAKAQSANVLERLTKDKAAADEKAETEKTENEPKVDHSKLAALATNVPAEVESKPAVEAKPAEDLSKANDKLSSLLGGDSPGDEEKK
ncbi:ABC transporter ATP-binding protein [Verrucomicrobia bacterium]|nr:ABC transporter ATP-binding protein [Verrucomicrobiota bacterium]